MFLPPTRSMLGLGLGLGLGRSPILWYLGLGRPMDLCALACQGGLAAEEVEAGQLGVVP